MQRPLAAIAVSTAFALVAGCATDDERYDDDYYDRQIRDIAGGGQPDWDERQGLFRELFGRDADGEAAEEERIAELEAQLRELEEERSERTDDREPVATERPRKRVGLLIDGEDDDLAAAFRAVALDHPLVVLDPERTREALADAGCDADDLAACAEDLAVYPGLRAVLTVAPDGETVTWTSFDTALERAHDTRTSELPTVDGRVPERAYEAFADQALLTVADRIDTAPWHARAFTEEDDGWVINAGEASGLERGDRLEVRGAPSVILSPNDRPIGWRAGSRKGLVEVSDFAGDDLAVITLLEGDGPDSDDVLLPADEE